MNLITASRVRARALELAREHRPKFKRVSLAFLDALDRRLDRILADAIHRHPSRGVTLKDLP